MKEVFAGIDLGGTGSRFVTYARNRVLASITVTTEELAAGDRAEKLARVVNTVCRLVPSASKLQGLGVGASGPVDRIRGVVNNRDTLPGFSGIRLVAGLQRRLGVPVTIDNDAMVAAIAEQRIGAGKKASRMLMVTLGTGIGVALVVDGKPFRGSDGAHPEASHIPIVSDARRCYCGIDGCWENLASRSALQRMLRPLVPSALADAEIVSYAVKFSHRKRMRQVFYEYGVLVGRGLLALHALYMPNLTVLGGSATDQFALFTPGLRASLAKSKQFGGDVKVRVSSLGDIAGAVGAAFIAQDASVLSH
ncbi:MAG: ROK family protein [Steroidobacteraceae bacterium]